MRFYFISGKIIMEKAKKLTDSCSLFKPLQAYDAYEYNSCENELLDIVRLFENQDIYRLRKYECEAHPNCKGSRGLNRLHGL